MSSFNPWSPNFFGDLYSLLLSFISRRYMYVYSPFVSIATVHHTNVTDAENFFNLGNGEILKSELPNTYVVVHVYSLYRLFERSDPLFFYVANTMRAELRRRYFLTKKPKIKEFHEDKINIAVHIRRGDITQNGKYVYRLISDDVIIADLRSITEFFKQRTNLSINVHIYSESLGFNASHYRQRIANKTHLDGDVFRTFHAMVMSDVLIHGRSSFSRAAGNLTNYAYYYLSSF